MRIPDDLLPIDAFDDREWSQWEENHDEDAAIDASLGVVTEEETAALENPVTGA